MRTIQKIILWCGDVALLYLSLGLMLIARYGLDSIRERISTHIGPFSAIFVVWILVFYLAGLYHHRTIRTRATFFRSFFPAIGIAIATSLIAFYLFGKQFELTPRINLFLFSGIFLLLEYIWRTVAVRIFKSRGMAVAFLGNSSIMHAVIDAAKHNPGLGYRVAAHISEIHSMTRSGLETAVKQFGIELIVVQPELSKQPHTVEAIYHLLPFGINIMNVSDFYEMIFEKIPLNDVEAGWFIDHISTRRPLYHATKRIVDCTIAGATMIVTSPLMIVIALLIKLTSRGPALYAQARTGQNGAQFMLYKFRTMQHHNQEGGADWEFATKPNDTRVTGIGKILRFTHLDELPQLWNIVRGDIAIVGPRPERSELAAQYASLPYYDMRHIIKPGLTGWAQVNYKPSASLEEAFEKLQYDMYYIKNRSLVLDLLIIVRTIRYFFTSH